MIVGRLVVGEDVLPSTGGRSRLRLILLLNEGDTGGQQGIGRQGSAQVERERTGVVAARWVEAGHLTLHLRASKRKILSVDGRRAASESAGCPPSSAAVHRHTCESIFAHRHMLRLCAKIVSGLVRGRGRTLERHPTNIRCGERLFIHGHPLLDTIESSTNQSAPPSLLP